MQSSLVKNIPFEQAVQIKNAIELEYLNSWTVARAIDDWLYSLHKGTALNYRSIMNVLHYNKFINLDMTMLTFSLLNLNQILDKIRYGEYIGGKISEATRQTRAACFISFTKFLHRKTSGLINKAEPLCHGAEKTFKKLSEKVKTEAMDYEQCIDFMHELHEINKRDCLIARMTLHGAKRIEEVLSAQIEAINWASREITFRQSKTFGTERHTVITYPKSFMDELYSYIGGRSGHIFITSFNCKVSRLQVSITFAKAGVRAKIPFRVTPHVLRASAVTYLRRLGYSCEDIAKVTGHASVDMVRSYDKAELSQNISKSFNLTG